MRATSTWISVLVILGGCRADGDRCEQAEFVLVGEDSHFVDGGPWVDALQIEPPTVTEGEQIVVSARLCHPDGEDAIDQVELRSRSHAISYGQLAREGADFVLRTSWDELHEAEPIEFAGATSFLALTVWADDHDGREASRGAELALHCDEGGACEGACHSLADDPENCGVCRGRCAALDQFVIGGICEAGVCRPALSQCFQASPEWIGDCAQRCQSDTCIEAACAGRTSFSYVDLAACEALDAALAGNQACDEVVGVTGELGYYRCCCGDYP